MPLAIAVGVPAGCAKPRAAKCLRLARRAFYHPVLFKRPDLAFTLGSTILVECVGNGRYSESPRELSRCRRRRHSVEKDGITGRLGLKFIRVEGQVPMSETAYSHAMAQRDVEIANLKREIAELRQIVSQNQGQIMNLVNAHRPILMQLCQRLGISTEIPDLPVK